MSVYILGIDSNKWNLAKKAKPEAAAAISSTNSEGDFDLREAVFEANRDAMTAAFKYVLFDNIFQRVVLNNPEL